MNYQGGPHCSLYYQYGHGTPLNNKGLYICRFKMRINSVIWSINKILTDNCVKNGDMIVYLKNTYLKRYLIKIAVRRIRILELLFLNLDCFHSEL